MNRCILFTGMSGSGKTTLSDKYGKKLGYRVIHIDDYTRDLIRKEYPEKTLLELEKELGVEKLYKIIQQAQLKAYENLVKKFKDRKVIFEATIIMHPSAWHVLDDIDCKIYAIEILPEKVISMRRLKRAMEKRKTKGLSPYTKEELKMKRDSSRFLYNKHLPSYKKFLEKYKDRITIVKNQ